MASKDDTSNLFNSATYDEEYWNIYLEARPEYSQAFYESVYGYHESHGGLTETALDIGTGPGQVAAELSTHFHHVVASDNNITHLEVARHRLGSLIPSHKVELLQCAGEEVARHIQPLSVDLVAAAECMPLMDAEKAIDAFAKVLKPNGTLAVWFYGRPYFAELEFRDQCQTILEEILDISYMRIVKGGGPQHILGWKRATDRLVSFLDDVELRTDAWNHIERHKINPEFEMCFYGKEACDFEVNKVSKIGKEERILHVNDLSFWEKHWDVAGARRFVTAILPPAAAVDETGNESIEGLYKDLEKAMGGEGAVRKITWPVVLILASKK